MTGKLRTTPQLEERLASLLQMPKGDLCTYVLSLHEIIVKAITGNAEETRAHKSFRELLEGCGKVFRKRGATAESLAVLKRIAEEHEVTLFAQRAALPLEEEEAVAATHNFLAFCALAGIGGGGVEELGNRLRAWKRQGGIQDGAALERLQAETAFSQGDREKVLAQTETWAREKQRLAELEGETMRLIASRDKESVREDAQRLAEITRLLGELEREKQELARRLEGYRDLDLYVHHVSRFSLYTRTRMDYERSVMQLTPEQAEALESVKPGFDFLIRGGAGTGKTIVLLHALGRIKRQRETELDLHPGTHILFLTYTTTLVKYDRYVASILREREADGQIMTADSFFLSRLTLLAPGQKVNYGILSRLAEKLNTTGFFTSQELGVEIEDFIFGNLVTRQEYVEEKIQRRGMRQPLSASQRAAVWAIRDRMIEAMEHDGLLSKNYSRLKLVEHLAASPADARLTDLDIAFVDESQDLRAADLKALKLMTRRGLILAGDTGQSIYGLGSPYKRADVDVAGRSRVLHTSFRNTIPIHEVTEAYRKLSGLDDEEAAATTAFREGPIPELYMAPTREELARLLLRKAALFIDRLGYDPENLTILAPTKTDLATMGDMLGHAGYRHGNIRDEDFSFSQQKIIRLSTLHSSKGLDFPVVLLYLPSLPPRTDYDEKSGETLVRNLIYVAMTRAMDNLNVFTLEGAHEGQYEEPLQDLVRVFARYRAAHGG